MKPISRENIEILLDTPSRGGQVVSAYLDLRVRDGFRRDAGLALRNLARAFHESLAAALDLKRKDLDDDLDAIRRAVEELDDPSAQGLAVFSGAGLREVIPLDFPVEDRLVVDEDPYTLPLLRNWFGRPAYLAIGFDSNEARLVEVSHDRANAVGDLKREDADEQIQRDKPQFTYKKRFAATSHERLHDAQDAPFLREVVEAVVQQWEAGRYAGLILLGQAQDVAALRKLLPKGLDARVAGSSALGMDASSDETAEAVSQLAAAWEAGRDREVAAELDERRRQSHLVATGATEVLDALQQGRAARILIGPELDLPGAVCTGCGYRMGAAVAICPYCQGRCRTVNALQEILRLAARHQVDVHVFRAAPQADPLGQSGGVAAFVRAEPNWASQAEPEKLATMGAGRAGDS
jgi:peptide subunit release factor 1 (eRF1)